MHICQNKLQTSCSMNRQLENCHQFCFNTSNEKSASDSTSDSTMLLALSSGVAQQYSCHVPLIQKIIQSQSGLTFWNLMARSSLLPV